MTFNTTVRLFSSERPQRPLPSVKVELYDRDSFSPDDLLGTNVTDAEGRARFEFSTRAFADIDDPSFGPVSTLPDLYVVARDAANQVVLSTRSQATADRVPPEIAVPVDRDQLARLRPRKPQPDSSEKRDAWLGAWKKRIQRNPGPGVIELCMTRVIVDMLAGASDPTSDLQKQTASALRDQLSAKQIKWLSDKATQARDAIDSSGLASNRNCSSKADPDALAKMLISADGPLSQIVQALSDVEPSPHDKAGSVRAGEAHKVPYTGWDDKCIQRFKGLLAPPLTGQPLTDMQQNYHEPNDLSILEPPRVDQIHVYENGVRHTVRKALTASNELHLWTLDQRDGLREDIWSMAVPSSDPGFLVNQLDSPAGNQVLVVDVLPGQPVTIKGRNFISTQAKVSVLFAEWEPIPSNVNSAQVLNPQAFHVDGSWQERDVQSGNPDGWDWILFDWPLTAGPGLYQMQFEFKNDTGLKTTAQPRQDPTTCALGLTGEMKTPVLYFAVLPPLNPRSVKVRATKIDCEDMTNPEFWPDDVTLVGATQLNRIKYDTSDPAAGKLVAQNTSTASWDKGHELCWDHQTLEPGDSNILPGNEVSHQLVMDRNTSEVLAITMIGAEIEGDADRAALIVVAIAVIVALWVLLAALIISAAVMATLFVILIAVIVASLSAGITAPVAATVAGAVIGGIWVVAGALLTATAGLATLAAGGATGLILAFVNDVSAVASATTLISAGELALRLSNVKFHQRIWQLPRPDAGNVEVSTQFNPQGFHEQYKGSNLGGTYKIFLDIEP